MPSKKKSRGAGKRQEESRQVKEKETRVDVPGCGPLRGRLGQALWGPSSQSLEVQQSCASREWVCSLDHCLRAATGGCSLGADTVMGPRAQHWALGHRCSWSLQVCEAHAMATTSQVRKQEQAASAVRIQNRF